MLRRLSPYLMVLLAVIVDTAILPVFYYGTYTVSLTLAVVLCASLVLGRLKGMLLGMPFRRPADRHHRRHAGHDDLL